MPPVTDRNQFYDEQQGLTGQQIAALTAGGVGIPAAGLGGAYLLQRQLGANAPYSLPSSVANMPLDILRPAGSQGAGGRFIPRNSLGSLMTQPTAAGLPAPRLGPLEQPMDIMGPLGRRGEGGRFLPRSALGSLFSGPSSSGLPASATLPYTPEMAAAAEGGFALGPANSNIYNNPALTAKYAQQGPSLFRAAAGEGGTAATAARAVPKTWYGRAGSTLGKGVLRGLPALAATLAAPEIESNLDELESSGMLGDVAGYATLGGGFGSFLGPWGTLGGTVLGGLYGGITGDRNPNNTPEVKEFDANIYGEKDKDGRPQGGAMIEELRDLKKQGAIDWSDEKIEASIMAYGMAREMGDKNPVEASQQIFGDLIPQIQAFDQKQIEEAPTPQEDLMDQLREIHEDQQQNLREAERYAMEYMAPIQAQNAKTYQDLAAVRDARLQDPNVPADVRASAMAMVPMFDTANLQMIQSAGSPIGALMQQQEQAYQSNLGDQLLQLYIANLQYGGGGADAGSLSELLQQPGALDAITGAGTAQPALPSAFGQPQATAQTQPTWSPGQMPTGLEAILGQMAYQGDPRVSAQ